MRPAITFLLLICFMNAQGQRPLNTDLTKEGLLKDIDLYKDGIINDHIDPFTKISKRQFLEDINKVKEGAVNQNADELFVSLMKVNAEIGDEHTSINFDEPRVFPIFCYWYEEGIAIINTDTSFQRYLFSKIIAIDHQPISLVVQDLSTAIADKNEGAKKLQVPKWFSSPTILHGFDIIGNKDILLLTVVTQANDTVTVPFPAMVKHEIAATHHVQRQMPLRYTEKKNYWYKYDDAGNFIYFNYTRCFDDPSYPFNDLQKEIFADISAKNAGKLIIDLRDNGGGNESILYPFINELATSGLNKANSIFVIIGRKTFSSALLNVLDIRDKIKVTTIGESTSGSINHFGEVRTFPLPDVGLVVAYSTKHFVRDANADGPIIPDIIIPETLSDYINGTDVAIDYAIAH